MIAPARYHNRFDLWLVDDFPYDVLIGWKLVISTLVTVRDWNRVSERERGKLSQSEKVEKKTSLSFLSPPLICYPSFIWPKSCFMRPSYSQHRQLQTSAADCVRAWGRLWCFQWGKDYVIWASEPMVYYSYTAWFGHLVSNTNCVAVFEATWCWTLASGLCPPWDILSLPSYLFIFKHSSPLPPLSV